MKTKTIIKAAAVALGLWTGCGDAAAWEGMAMPELHVEGRWLKDSNGNKVNLHGFAQTYSPWFNHYGDYWPWNNYNVNGCLKFNKSLIDRMLEAGWQMNFVRLHMDPYWSNTPGMSTDGESDISAFDFQRFKKYLDEVFIPMAEYAVSKGLYVVMRPPGVCPENIAVGDKYHKYLLKVWTYVAQHPKLQNHPNIMFELANEPINIKGTDGNYGNNGDACFEALSDFFQEIVDSMRAEGCHNILWVPGLCWQMHYAGYAKYPIQGENIGYAVHLYPGWFGSSSSFSAFQSGWNADVKPAADIAPIMVTEMDWADEKWNASWGKAHTGVPYGEGNDNFGANFKLIVDASENVSWLLFTDAHFLADFKDVPANPNSFLTDPESCPWPVYHWYKEYSEYNYPRDPMTCTFTSDNGDGTYNNPVIYGDFPDADVIRVDDTYYMISTSMYYMPGATIMRSKDLVNWEYAANPLEYIELSDAYCLENGKNSYSRGQWASALQYHDGQFYLLFNTLADGAYLMTAEDIDGPWTKKKLNRSFYDCGLLFDGNDIYIVHGNTEIWISKVDEDFNVIETHKVYTGPADNAIEGSHLYHIGKYYYVYLTYSGWPGKQTCLRSESIFGTYTEKILLDKNAIHQGALVNTPGGDWYTILHRDMWPWGRMPYLLPVKFTNGWPVIAEGITDLDRNLPKPDIDAPYLKPQLATNDAFCTPRLGKQWQWNHVPDATKWSLLEEPGYLRLYTASVTDNIYNARNTLTQRMLGNHRDKAHSYGTVCLDLEGMKDGDRAGLTTIQDQMASVGVKKVDGKYRLYYAVNSLTGKQGSKEVDCGELNRSYVYLRGVASFNSPGVITYYYSTDNVTYNKLGEAWTMQYDLSVFTGNRWGIFNYATSETGGYVDVDWFATEPDFEEYYYFDTDNVDYSLESLTAESLTAGTDVVVIMTGANHALNIKAVFADGHTEDVSTACKYEVHDPSVAEIKNGSVTGLRDGCTNLTITYKDPLGNMLETEITIESTTFPLVEGLFNPSIYAEGTFDESTKTATTGQYGFAGWHYDSGVDLSDYKYLVAKVAKSPQAGGLSFRVFDENNYWAGAHEAAKKSKGREYDYFLVDLSNSWKADNSRKIDPRHIYYVGFWTLGGSPFVILDVYATNDSDYLNHTGIADIEADDCGLVDVYTVDGVLLHRQITRGDAFTRLPSGLYIIGGTKVLIMK